MRVVSDFREAMWGVLQQGVSTLDVDFVAYAAGQLRPAAARTPPARASTMRSSRCATPVADGTLIAGDRPPTPERGSRFRAVALGVVAFVATLILLFGALNVVRRSDGGAPVPSSSAGGREPRRPRRAPASPSAAGSASGSAAPVAERRLDGVGLAVTRRRSRPWSAPATSPTAASTTTSPPPRSSRRSRVRSSRPATTPTRAGPAQQFHDCYDPTWGAFRDRTRPAPGNHDWETKDLAGYLGYFGTAAAPDGTSWYSYDLGAWHVIVLDSDCSNVGGCGAGFAAGSMAERGPGGVDRAMHARDLAPPAVQLRATTATTRRSRRSGRRSTTQAPTSSSTATTTTTSGSHHRTRARHADGSRGIREFVVGTGGAELRPFFDAKANSELRYSASSASSSSTFTRRRTAGRSSRRRATSATPEAAPCH